MVMTALFSWKAKPYRRAPVVGDTRIVNRFLLIPHCIEGEWRFIGMQRIKQEAYSGMSYAPGMPKGVSVLRWLNIEWIDETPEEQYTFTDELPDVVLKWQDIRKALSKSEQQVLSDILKQVDLYRKYRVDSSTPIGK